MIVVAAVLLGGAAGLWAAPAGPTRSRSGGRAIPVRPILGAVLAFAVIGGPWGVGVGIVVAVVLLRVGRPGQAEDPTWDGAAPLVASLIATATRAGVPPEVAVSTAATMLSPEQARGLREVTERWRYGLSALDADLDRPALLMARAVEQSYDSGAAPGAALERVAEDLTADIAAQAQERARRVGVRAAVPLGVCLLPAFLCLGVVPLVASLMSAVA